MSDIRKSGDEWVTASDGNRYWGTYGAAGLLAYETNSGILLQHRVNWSDHGGTWGIPGGALHADEKPMSGALRESHEEAAVPPEYIQPRFSFVLDRGGWQYTTVLAEVTTPFTPRISDPESHELRWVPVEDVASFSLHPAFETAWVTLRDYLARKPIIVLDCTDFALSGQNALCCSAGSEQQHRSSVPEAGAPPEIWGFTAKHPTIARVFPDVVCSQSIDSLSPVVSENNASYRLAIQGLSSGHAVALVTSDESARQRFLDVGGSVLAPERYRDLISLN